MNSTDNTIDSISLSTDDEILRFLKGSMSQDEESSFLKRMQSNPELKSKTITMARLVKGLKEVGEEQDKDVKDAFRASTKDEVQAVVEAVTREKKGNVISMRRAPVWISIAASFVFVIWSGIGFYDKQQTIGLANEYAGIIGTSSFSRDAQGYSEAEIKLTKLFDNIDKRKNLDNTLHDLSLYWELSTMDTYNDYTDYANEIGWNLAIGYLKDNDKKSAKKTLEKLISISPENSITATKSKELLTKIKH